MIQQLFKGRFSLLTMVFVALLALAGCQSKPQGLTRPSRSRCCNRRASS